MQGVLAWAEPIQFRPSASWGFKGMKRSKIGPLLGIGRGPHAAALACMIAVIAAVPRASHAADAECGVSDSGIPDGVIIPIDVAHMRKSLADMGLGISGIYTGEVFANTGGLK